MRGMHPLEVPRRPAPRPVQARSQETRAKVLEAAVAVLYERGYAGANTNLIAAHAGVSQGAMYRHFPIKLDLFEAALADLLAGARARFREAFDSDPAAAADPAAAVVRHLWDVFATPPLQAAFELYQAARTEPALAERVAPLIADHRARAVTAARAPLPDAARENAGFDGAGHALMSTLQGAAVVGALAPGDGALAETQRRSIERMLRNELEPGAAAR